MKALLTVTLVIASLCCFSQGVDTSINVVSNLKLKYEFQKMKTYDYDLEIYTDELKVKTLIVFKIETDGTGQLFIYLSKKMTLSILKCTYRNEEYNLTLINDSGHEISSTFTLKDNKAVSFRIKNDVDNTAIVFSD